MKEIFLPSLMLICIGQIAICSFSDKGKSIMQIEEATSKLGPSSKASSVQRRKSHRGIVIKEPKLEDPGPNPPIRADLSRSHNFDQSTFKGHKSDQSTFEGPHLNHRSDIDRNYALSSAYSVDTMSPEDVESLWDVLAETGKNGDPEPAHTLQNLDSATQRTPEQPSKINLAQKIDPLDAEPHSTSSQKAASIPETGSKENPLQIQNQQELAGAKHIIQQARAVKENLKQATSPSNGKIGIEEKPSVIEAHDTSSQTTTREALEKQGSLQIQLLSDISAYTSQENSHKISTARGQASSSNPEKSLDRVRSARRTKKTKSTRSKDDAFPHSVTNVPPPSDAEKNLSQGNVDPPHGQGGIYEYAPPYHQSPYRPAGSAYEYGNPIPVEMQQQQMSHSQIHLVFFIAALSLLVYIHRLF